MATLTDVLGSIEHIGTNRIFLCKIHLIVKGIQDRNDNAALCALLSPTIGAAGDKTNSEHPETLMCSK
jgi:hypothetical protein